jgi:hypothetical protein
MIESICATVIICVLIICVTLFKIAKAKLNFRCNIDSIAERIAAINNESTFSSIQKSALIELILREKNE